MAMDSLVQFTPGSVGAVCTSGDAVADCVRSIMISRKLSFAIRGYAHQSAECSHRTVRRPQLPTWRRVNKLEREETRLAHSKSESNRNCNANREASIMKHFVKIALSLTAFCLTEGAGAYIAEP